MPVQKSISKEYRIYLAIWRKAWLDPNNLIRFKCSNLTMAVAMRQGMYRAIRPFRNGLMNDEELAKASEKYVIYLEKPEGGDKDDPHWLVVRERATLSELEGLVDLLGIDEEDLKLGDERVLKAKLDHLLEESEAVEASAPRVTKFFTRDS